MPRKPLGERPALDRMVDGRCAARWVLFGGNDEVEKNKNNAAAVASAHARGRPGGGASPSPATTTSSSSERLGNSESECTKNR